MKNQTVWRIAKKANQRLKINIHMAAKKYRSAAWHDVSISSISNLVYRKWRGGMA